MAKRTKMNGELFRTLLRGRAKREDLTEALDEIGVSEDETFVVGHPEVVGRRIAKAGCCIDCEKPIDVNTGYRRVEGWAKPRSDGGTNALALREVHEDEWCCPACIEDRKRGVPVGQQTLA